ncbi:MAG: pyridoxamine 5'-phosphate oxidase family protein [Thermoleophilaceae bacterium]|nr:pyridoxamine 5'-phosphate oxidase family protein [Thermoleophilaceae bacterium]
MNLDPRELLASIRYMTLATVGADGRPWASPVWYAAPAPSELLWVSQPGARHSRNIANRPEVAIVIFDSTVPNEDAQAVYMEATASQTGEGVERLSAASVSAGGEPWTAAEVTGSAKHRLYRADVTRCWMLGAEEERVEVKLV